MALHIDTITEIQPSLPDGHAHEANKNASYAADAKGSKQALERKIRVETDHPTHKKMLAVSPQSTVIYGALAIALSLNIYWEWSVSREIYEVMISGATPWVPFLGCVAIAFYASICIAESTSRFSVLSTEDNSESNEKERTDATVGRQYDTRGKRGAKTNWLFNPLTGALVALLFLVGIYLVSRYRVELLSAAGEMRADTFQIWLPVILYAIEIMLGIPTFFFAIWLYTCLHVRSRRRTFSRLRMNELLLCQSAVQAYSTYMRQFELFNDYARTNNEIEAHLVPPNTDLRGILAESGYNFTNGDDRESPIDATADHRRDNHNDKTPPETPAAPRATERHVEAPNINAPHNGHDQNRREEDLLALLDEEINAKNRGL